MKTALFIDGLDGFGGGQRYALYVAEVLNPDIFTGFYRKTFPGFQDFSIKVLGQKISPSFLGAIILMAGFNKLNLPGYDLYVFMGNLSLAAVKKEHRPSIWISFGPMRRLYLEKPGLFTGMGNTVLRKFFSTAEANISEIDLIIAISGAVKKRLLNIYGTSIKADIRVIYPPIKVEKFFWQPPEDYYLYVGRLDRKKRVDVLINTFSELKTSNLKIVGDGKLRGFVEKQSARFHNIEYLGPLSEEDLLKVYSKAIATIYIPYEEDFGLIPVESQAAGKPCIGASSGGVIESVIHKETGFLIDEPVDTGKLREAIEWMSRKRAEDMRDRCMENARRFSFERFSKELKQAIGDIGSK